MSKKAIAISVTVLFALAICLAAFFTSAKPTQIVEQDGNRTTEYHLFGAIPFPTTRERVDGLEVSNDVREKLVSNIRLPSGMRLGESTFLLRTLRPSGTEYFAYVPYVGDAKLALQSMRKDLTKVRDWSSAGIQDIEGVSKSGMRVRAFFVSGGPKKEFGISVTDPKPAY